MLKKLSLLTLAASATLFSSIAFSATDGTSDTTSTGSVDIQVTKGDGVRISDLQDFDFGVGTTVPLKLIDDICIYSTTGSYNITVFSNGNGSGGTQLRMTSATTTEFIQYFAQFRPDTNSQSGNNLSHNIPSATYNNADTVSDSCSGGVNSRLIIEISEPSYNAATPDTYTDTLTLLVQPI